MFAKIKSWLLGKVLMSKVGGKFIKHGAGVIVGFIFGPKLAPILGPILDGINLTEGQVEAGLVVFFTAVVGALVNFLKHRFIK